MKEIIDLRKPREKHFLNEDGTYTLYAYDHDVHCLKNGKYVDIDNTIIEQGDCFKNKENGFSISFAKTSENPFLLKIEKENHFLNLDLIEKNVEAQVLNNSITYQNILKNIDIRYDLMDNKVKDTIVLKNIDNSLVNLIYRINTNFVLELDENGLIDVLKDNICLFKIDKPTLMDKDGQNYPIQYILEQSNGDYLLSFSIEDAIFTNQELYPLTIDPTIEMKEDNSIFDTYIYPGDTNVNRNSQDMLKVGVDSNNVVYRTLMKFNLPTIGTACDIVDARVCLVTHEMDPYFINNDFGNPTIEVHAINTSWEEAKANWNSMHNQYNEKIEDFFYGRYSIKMPDLNENGGLISYHIEHDIDEFNLTNLVKRWYAGEKNNGILLKWKTEEFKEEIGKVCRYYSKNNNTFIENYGNPKPFLMITYRNQNGLENYMTYQSIGFSGGESHINNLTGNVTNVFEINKTLGTKFPINLNLIYNTNDVILNKKYGMPKGFKFNYHETLKEVNFDNVCLEYIDGDGTIHYFREYKEFNDKGEQIGETKIIDEDGLGLTAIKQNGNNTYIIKDKEGNEKEFICIQFPKNDEYVLGKITNTNKDYIEIGYIDTSFSEDEMLQNNLNFGDGISSICDNEGNKINIQYNYVDDAFSYITISSSYTTTMITLFGENNDKIQRINNKFGTIALDYNNQGILTKITDTNGLAKQYEYYENIPYRLKKISELGTNEGIGNYLEFFYDFNVTRVKDNKGRINSYAFNDQGNTIGITNLDADGDFKKSYGILQEYASDFDGTMPNLKNKLQLETTAMKYTNNYLYNSSFEKEDSNLNITTECAHSGTHSLKVNETYSMKLPKVKEEGMYIFSAYFKNEKSATLCVCSSNEEVLKEVKINPNSDFVRYAISTTLNNNLDYYVKFVSNEPNGIIYIDDMQLEKGEIANYHNLVENSNFQDGLISWDYRAVDNEGNTLNDGSGVITLPNGEKAFLMHCAPDTSKALDQLIPVSGKANDTYRLSFWYKNEGIRESGMESSNMALLSFSYPDTEEGECIIPCILNIHATEWQFFQTVFVAEQDYKDAYLSFISQNNANDFYITNITLTKDLENNSYGYDEEGNLIVALGKNKGVSKFHYDKNNQLISTFEPKGNSFKFEYDNKDTSKLLQGISKKGISNKLVYDESNNPIKTIIQNNETTELNGKSFYIRLKATNEYLFPDYQRLMPTLKVPTCSNESWDIIKEENYYIIKSSVIPLYLNIDSKTNKFILSKELNNKFELIENKNGSYTIKQADSNLCLAVEEKSFIGSEYIEEDVNQQFYLEPFDSKKYIETSAEYTSDGRFIKSTTDALGRVTNYDIDTKNGLVNSITDPMEQTTNYTYNFNEQITKVEKNKQETIYEYNDNNTLSKIICPNKEYNFTYDEFLNTKEVKVNNQVLVTNEYEENNGNLKSSQYGNNTSIAYTYDELDRIKTLIKNNKTYNYHYNNLNHLSKITSIDETYNYYYDLAERLSRYECNNGSIEYDYDLNNNVTKKKYQQENLVKEITYTYDEDDSIIKVTLDNQEVNFIYDELGRLSNKTINHHLPIEYEYYSNGNKTSMILKSMKIDNDLYEYVYDELYNITDIYKNGEIKNHYEYDNFNELIEDDNYELNKTYKFIYDTNGNILTKEEFVSNTSLLIKTDTYEYSNLNWQDQLTKFNDISITYDEIGNPTKIGDTNLTWNIRELQRYQNTMLDSQYFYNKEGIRTKKIVNGVETNYFLENSNILFEETKGNVLYYMRTDENDLIGFQYNNETYYYKKNYQGDILGIYNSNYELECTYEYDSYGSIVSIKDVLGTEIEDENHIGNINPYRYRSYYYDKETKLYYLNSRYYNPLWGRFINADGIIGTSETYLGYNLYAYCENNPITNIDGEGNFSFKNMLANIGNGLNKAVNAVSNTYNKAKSGVNNMINSIGQFAQKVKNSFTVEAGIGFGVGAKAKVGSVGGEFGAYKTFNTGISNNKKYNSTTSKIGATASINSKKAGLQYEITHYDDGNRIHDNVMSMPWEVLGCSNTIVNATFGLSNSYSGSIENSNDGTTFIGIDLEGYALLGGHFKIGFNW